MTINYITKEKVRIECFTLAEFIEEIVKMAKLGFNTSESNDEFPQGFSGWYSAGMNKSPSVSEEDFDYSGVEAVQQLVKEAYDKGVVAGKKYKPLATKATQTKNTRTTKPTEQS